MIEKEYTTLNADERLAESQRIVKIIHDECPDFEFMAKENEVKFVEDMATNNNACSVKQLFWLRSIKQKYVD